MGRETYAKYFIQGFIRPLPFPNFGTSLKKFWSFDALQHQNSSDCSDRIRCSPLGSSCNCEHNIIGAVFPPQYLPGNTKKMLLMQRKLSVSAGLRPQIPWPSVSGPAKFKWLASTMNWMKVHSNCQNAVRQLILCRENDKYSYILPDFFAESLLNICWPESSLINDDDDLRRLDRRRLTWEELRREGIMAVPRQIIST